MNSRLPPKRVIIARASGGVAANEAGERRAGAAEKALKRVLQASRRPSRNGIDSGG